MKNLGSLSFNLHNFRSGESTVDGQKIKMIILQCQHSLEISFVFVELHPALKVFRGIKPGAFLVGLKKIWHGKDKVIETQHLE
jgi:hypothetical protein